MEAASPNSTGLPGSALLVRGGRMFRADLEDSAERHFLRFGHYALSFWSVPGRTAQEIAEQIGTEELPHRTMRSCPVERLRRLGYEVMFTGRPWHVSVILPTPPSDADWDNLEQAFDPPEPNPVAR